MLDFASLSAKLRYIASGILVEKCIPYDLDQSIMAARWNCITPSSKCGGYAGFFTNINNAIKEITIFYFKSTKLLVSGYVGV